jgi:thiamine-monophosphate kinase
MKERELISHITSILDIPNDDAFVFPVNNTLFSITIDTLVAKTDVPPGMTSPQIGWKAVVMNLSDLAAMGSDPEYFLCSLVVPKDYPVLDIVKGVKSACDHFNCIYAGGDLNEGDLSVSGVAVGTSLTVMPRNGAQPGDKVGITGDIGRVYAGLHNINTATPSMKEKIFTPYPRLTEAKILHAHSCIDISDGLSSELHHIAAASNVRIDIDSDKIPIHPDVTQKAYKKHEDPVTWALKSGEEYELLFTNTKIPDTATEIGKITTGKGIYIDSEPMPMLGWEHL